MAALGCCVCRREFGVHTPPAIHHLRGHPWAGTGQRADDAYTIPLCNTHHQTGGHGVAYHAGAQAFEARFGTQAELLAWTNLMIGDNAGVTGLAPRKDDK
jgi:hypothetical protein